MGLTGTTALGQGSNRPADGGGTQVALINAQVRQVWSEHHLRPSEMATDGEWCRRVFLDVLGRTPSVEELRRFVERRDAAKKRKLIDELLDSEAYTDDYVRNWTTFWTNVLIGRSGGTDQNSLIHRAGMQKYLRDSIARNKPYDRMVY